MRRVPERFRVRCHFCDDELDMRAQGVFALRQGWVKNRKAGGGNALALARDLGEYSCEFCMDRETSGQARWQMNLFG